ncbi:MAG: tRNA threonylcarbamoyladenosine dehydratase [Clostridia bacterium]|nr:tRNA threonylcarbamoyladenosine dehydratase [Clostridia bacterium]
MEIYKRTDMLIGEDNRKKLGFAHVAVFGVGGVGSYVCEALARAGVGAITLIDGDTVQESNINRQLIALHSTVGLDKVEVMKTRIFDINPDIKVLAKKVFYCEENADTLDFSQFSYVVDAIDTVTSKLLIIENAKKFDVPIISSMGTGNKLDASAFKICDIKKTSVCPLARVMRSELRSRGIENVKVLYSEEQPQNREGGRTPASISYVPSVAGLLIAGEVIKDIISK